MREEHAIGQQLAEPCLRPSVHDAPNDEMKISARVDVVRNTRGNDGQDMAGALAALVEPREEPILATEDQPSQLPLAAVVGGLDVSIFEKEEEPLPLSVQISERLPEWRLRWNDRAVSIDPRAELVCDGPGMRLATLTPLLCGIARERRCALDDEQSGNDVQAFQCDGVARAGSVHETASSVAPAAGALAADAFQEAEDVGAVALHGTREVFAEKAFDAVGVAARRIEESDPARIRPAPHGAAADAFGRGGVENRDTGGVGAEQARGARLLCDELGHGREQVDRRSDASSECLRGDVDPRAREARGLPLDRLVLQVLVAGE